MNEKGNGVDRDGRSMHEFFVVWFKVDVANWLQLRGVHASYFLFQGLTESRAMERVLSLEERA